MSGPISPPGCRWRMPGPAPVRAGLRDPRGSAWSRRRRGAGKTMLLQKIARAIERNHPEASTFDESPVRHVQVAEIVIAKARGRAENRRNVVVLRDPITRLARADQHVPPPPGKALPGGVDRSHGRSPSASSGRAQARGGWLAEHRRHRAGRDRARGRRDLRAARGHGNAEIRLDRARMERAGLHAPGCRAAPGRAGPRRAMTGSTGRARARRICSCPRACWTRSGAALAPVSARRGRSLERLRSGMIQTESNEAFLAILRSPGRAAAIRQRAH